MPGCPGSSSETRRGPISPWKNGPSLDDILGLLSLCLDSTFLSFRGKVYRQVHGTAMGSLVSIVIANLVMKDVEERAFATFHSPPRFWKHYVYHTCTALPRDMVKSFQSHLNSIEPCCARILMEPSPHQCTERPHIPTNTSPLRRTTRSHTK